MEAIMESKINCYNTYKQSGIKWLGEIPGHWEVKRLAAFSKFSKGGGFSKANLVKKGVSAILYGDIYTQYDIYIKKEIRFIKEETSKRSVKVDKHDLLFTGSGETKEDIGKCVVFLNDNKAYAGGDVIILKQDENDSLFLSYILNSEGVRYEKAKSSKGEIIVHTYASKLREISIPIPPLPEQTAIANFLDDKTIKIDQAIGIKEQQIALLKERKQILIHKAVTRGLDENVKLKDSGVEWIGEIPEGWEVKKIKHVTSKIGSGVTPSGGGTTYLEEGIPLLRSQNIFFDKIELDGVACISDKVHQSMSNSQVFKGDVLLNITGGSIGRCYFVDVDFPLNVNQHVCILRPNKKITTLYLNRLIASEVGQNQIWFHQQGGGREGLNFQALKNFSIPFPPLSEQKEISEYIESASQKIQTAISIKKQEIEKLKEYKSSLINSVVTGKVKVC